MQILGQELEGAVIPLKYAALSALLALAFGYDLGMLFVNQQYFSNYYILNGSESDVIIGTSLLGMIVGVFLGGWLNYGSGRRLCLLCSAGLGALSIGASIFAPNLSIFLCAQFVIGFCWGLLLLSSILYVPEITQPKHRGLACSLNSVSFAGGAFIAVLLRDVNPLRDTPLVVLSLSAFTLAVWVLAAVKLPESPRYLASVSQSDSALNVLFKLRRSMGLAARELAGINECYRQEARGAQFFLQSPSFRRSFWTLMGLILLLQASGLSVIPFALSDFFMHARSAAFQHGYDFSYGLMKAVFTVGFCGVLTAALMVDRLGRRALLCAAAMFMSLSLALLLICFIIGRFSIAPLIITLGVLLYFYAASICIVIITALLLPELSPGRGREFACAGVLVCSGVASLFSLQVYFDAAARFGFAAVFLFFFTSSLIFLLVCLLCVPNTTSSSLEGIENRLLEGAALRDLGRMRDRRED